MEADRHKYPRDVAAAINAYFTKRWNRRQPVSTADGVRGVRAQLPDCELPDHALAELIAERAIRQGYDVSFDSDEIQSN